MAAKADPLNQIIVALANNRLTVLSMHSSFYTLALPHETSTGAEWDQMLKVSAGCPVVIPLQAPRLPPASLDTLQRAADDLDTLDAAAEGVLKRVSTAFWSAINSDPELKAARPTRRGDLGAAIASVVRPECSILPNGHPVDAAVATFRWDSAKYSETKPLDLTIKTIMGRLNSIDSELKNRNSALRSAEQRVEALERASSGPLTQRDLSGVALPEDLIETEHMTTVFVVVPKFLKSQFLEEYSVLERPNAEGDDKELFVVPESAKLIVEDSEASVYRVVVFKKDLNDFSAAARLQRYVVRDAGAAGEGPDASELHTTVKQARAHVLKWVGWSLSDVLSARLHLHLLRLRVEGTLRYGDSADVDLYAVPAPSSGPADKSLRHRLKITIQEALPSTIGDTEFCDDFSKIEVGTAGNVLPFTAYRICLAGDNAEA